MTKTKETKKLQIMDAVMVVAGTVTEQDEFKNRFITKRKLDTDLNVGVIMSEKLEPVLSIGYNNFSLNVELKDVLTLLYKANDRFKKGPGYKPQAQADEVKKYN